MNIKFKIEKHKKLKAVKIIKASKYIDHRGFIYTNFNKELEKRILPKNYHFNHCKINFRRKNVLVGIHYDFKTWKLVSCLKGKIFQVITCFEKNSSILVPPKYGSSFYCYKDSIILYQFSYHGKYLDHKEQKTISWSDKKLNIKWPAKRPILSKRDNF
jgi:dTDP-4-dehydrorhamnose 3,5-epimerase